MTSLRTTLWSPEYLHRHGGIQQFSQLMHEGMRTQSVVSSCVLVTLTGGTPTLSGKVFFTLRAVMDALLRRPDLVVITHLHLARLSGMLRLLRIPYWVCAHGVEFGETSGSRDLTSLSGADRILCVSRYTESKILSLVPSLQGKTCLFPNHVVVPDTRLERLESRILLGLPREARVLLTLSRLSSAERYKGHREILHVLPALRAEYPDLVYVVAGDGDDKVNLENLTRKLDLASCVIFLGSLDDRQREAAYSAADALAMPSTGEGFGIVFLEALIRGIPVLAGDRDGSRDPLQDGVTGVLVNAQDPGSLMAGLKDLLGRNWDRDFLIQATREKFGIGRIPERLSRLLEAT